MTELLKRKFQLSYERHNISELARELGITAPNCISGVKE
jgi:transposase